MINSCPTIWLIDLRQEGPPETGKPRQIKKGPLIDLKVLQAAIATKQLSDDGVWPATRRCRNSLEDYGWNFGLVLEMLSCLLPDDYKNSEWCDVDGNLTVPCDVYRICFDEVRRKRNSRACEIYLKFSIDDDGILTLVLVQSHFS